jgi:hypothetical protein
MKLLIMKFSPLPSYLVPLRSKYSNLYNTYANDQPSGLVVRVSDYWLWSPGFDSNGNHGLGSLVELRLRPLLVLNIHISPSTSSGQRNCVSWASQFQKSVTLRPQPGGESTKSIRDMWWHWKKEKNTYENFTRTFQSPVYRTTSNGFYSNFHEHFDN